jgi:hypothetical protein
MVTSGIGSKNFFSKNNFVGKGGIRSMKKQIYNE